MKHLICFKYININLFKLSFMIYFLFLIFSVDTLAISLKDNRYYYNNKDFYKSCWQWSDLNNDGLYECYYFNILGHMTKNSTTPDGYNVNEDGEWIVNGVVQRKDNIGVMEAINDNLVNNNSTIYNNIVQEANTDFSMYLDNFINDRVFDIQNYIRVKEIDKKLLEKLRSKYTRDMDIIYNNYYKSLTELYDDKHITRENLKETIAVLSNTLKEKKKIINANIDTLKNTITWQFNKNEYDIKMSVIE